MLLCRAAEQEELTPALVAHAPMLGLDAWAAASRLLAKQLEKKQQRPSVWDTYQRPEFY